VAVALAAGVLGAAAGVWAARRTPAPTYTVMAAPGQSPFLLPPAGEAAPTGRTDRFTLTAAPGLWHIYPGETVQAWLFNGVSPGPTLTVTEGDTVEVTVVNHLPEALTVAFPTDSFSQAGVAGISQKPIFPGQRFTYRFTAPPAGTYAYASSFDVLRQVNFGLYGAFISGPQQPPAPTARFDVDQTVVIGEWPSPGDYDAKEATYFTLNGYSYPATPPIWVRRGDRVRLRLINAGAMMWHDFELEGHTLWLIARDGVPVATPQQVGSVDLGPGESADVAFIADNPGNWPLVCNVLDHEMNLDLPGPGGLIDLVRYEGFSGGLPPAANELGVAETDLWRAQQGLNAGDGSAAQAAFAAFASSWQRIGRDVAQVDPGDALRIDQVLAQTRSAWSSDPRFLPTALQNLDDTVDATIDAINASRVGMPNP
jgi:FtsP/CotA-like multicopper oxidase with cupredoxin domain